MLERPSSRLLVVDSLARLLLFRFAHKSGALAGQNFWATPGGGLEESETYEHAACRELFEEVGLQINHPGPEVARREAIFALPTGEMVRADERFFLVRINDVTISRDGWSDLERDVMTEHRWWTFPEVRDTREQLWPEDISEILIKVGVW